MSSPNARALGIDTSLRSTGVAVVDLAGSRYTVVEYGLLKNPTGRPGLFASSPLATLQAIRKARVVLPELGRPPITVNVPGRSP